MATIRQLQSCPKKAYFNSLGIKTEKGIAIYVDEVARKILKESQSFYALENVQVVRKSLDELIPQGTFTMKHEREINLDVASGRIARMGSILTARNYTYAGDGEMYRKAFVSQTISGIYSFKAEKDGITYAVKTTYGKADVSMLTHADSYIGNSVEYYMMQKATGLAPMIVSLGGADKSYEAPEDLTIQELQSDKKIVGKYLFYVDFSTLKKDTVDKLEEALNSISQTLVSKDAEENTKNCNNCPWKNLCQIEDIDYSDVLDVPEVEATKAEPVFEWTKAQEQFIHTRTGETRVYAVAGSGKTTCIAKTVLDLAEEGVGTNAITLCTFTNKGVAEIKQKLDAQIKSTGRLLSVNDFHIVSLNGLGYEVIKRYYALHGKEEPQIISENDLLLMIMKVADSVPMVPGLNYANPMLKMFNAYGAVHKLKQFVDIIMRSNGYRLVNAWQVNKLLGMDNSGAANCIKNKDKVLDKEACDLIARIYNDVVNQMQEESLITYDDQISQAIRILDKNEQILQEFQDKCRYLIVDEFQDTSLAQMKLVDKLYVPSENSMLAVVGDANQSIMQFRGVGNENILKFNELYPNAVTINMNRNFRSTREICDIAENVMMANGVVTELQTDSHGEKPVINLSPDKSFGNAKAIETVLRWIGDGVPMSDIAVIARTRSELLDIRKRLATKDVPVMISVSEFLKDDNQLIAASNLAEFLADNSKIKELAIWSRRSNRSSFDDADDIDGYLGVQAALLDEEFADKDDTEMYDAFIEKMKATFDTFSKPFESVVNAEEGKKKSFTRFAKKLREILATGGSDGTEKDDKVYNAVSLTTVHSAKGREWNNVVVCANGFKDKTGLKDKGGITELSYDAEEVRCLFVAVTRAKKFLEVECDGYWDTCLHGLRSADTKTLVDTGVKVSIAKPKATKK